MLPLINEELWHAIISHSYDIEFDWIGIDNTENLGIFSSFNRGWIPKLTISSFEKYQKLASIINNLPFTTKATQFTSEKGHFRDWIEYSKKGIFAFDYQDIHRTEKFDRYDLISLPKIPIKLNQLNDCDSIIDILPRFNLPFDNNLSFKDLEKSLHLPSK